MLHYTIRKPNNTATQYDLWLLKKISSNIPYYHTWSYSSISYLKRNYPSKKTFELFSGTFLSKAMAIKIKHTYYEVQMWKSS